MLQLRIGNDVRIRWEIFKSEGIPEDFTDASTIVFIKQGKYKCELEHVIEDNIIIIDYLAKEQLKPGIYDLFLQITKPDDSIREGIATYTIDNCDFLELLPKTCDIEETQDYEHSISGTLSTLTYGGLSEQEKDEITQRLIASGFWAKINIVDEIPENGNPGEFYATFEGTNLPYAIINVVNELPTNGEEGKFYATFE